MGPEAAHSRGPHRLQPNGDDIRLRHRTAALQQPIDHLVELELPASGAHNPTRTTSPCEPLRTGQIWAELEMQGASRSRKSKEVQERRAQERTGEEEMSAGED